MKLHAQQILAALLLLGTQASSAMAQHLERDLAYGPDSLQRLDLSTPASRGFPTLIFIHGGSLTSGDKGDEDYRAVCAPFPAEGIACASINYRLGPINRWPAQAQDVAAAVAWLRANIAERGGDPASLFLFGHSSGAALAALLGADERYLHDQGLATTDLRGVIAMGSIMWDNDLEQAVTRRGVKEMEQRFPKIPDFAMYQSLEMYRDHWPIGHVRRGMPPYLFLIADSERVQPPILKTDSTFVARAIALGNHAEYQVLPGRSHYSAIRRIGEPGDSAFALVHDFVMLNRSAGDSP
ncbi:MAG TPA: alpha/beta hydrolase [Gemmatimonadales bacterium]|jgi:acetyl esterase/lipase